MDDRAAPGFPGRAGDRRGTAREAERERKRREKQERNEKILQLYIDGEGNYEQIALMAGCSIS